MGEVPAEFCGYEWPKDCERFEYDDRPFLDKGDSHWQTTCVRETLPDADRCAWHAAPDETEHKSIETLRDARVPAEIRTEEELNESLDGAVLAGVEIRDELNLSGTLFRGANLSGTDLTHANLSEANVRDADLSKANLTGADLSKADFTAADLSEVKLIFTDLLDVNLTLASLSEADLTGADLPEAYLSFSDLSNANLTGADLDDTNLSEADLTGADLSEADLEDTNLSEADLTGVNLSEADLTSADFLNTNIGHATLTGAEFANAELSNLTVDCGTTADELAEPEPLSPLSAFQRDEPDGDENESNSDQNETETNPDNETSSNDWDRTARAYHDLKTEFHNNGFVVKARQLHIRERRARRRETAVEEGWFSRQHLTQFVSGLFTGYGVGVWRLVGTMTALFAISTVTYALAGVADPLTYSTITFATSPPRPTGSLPIWARLVANVETFVGTLLIVSLGFVLGNREQF